MGKQSFINRDLKNLITDKASRTNTSTKPVALTATFVVLAALLYFTGSSSALNTTTVITEKDSPHVIRIALPNSTPDATSLPPITATIGPKTTKTAATVWQEYTVKPGDNLAKIFNRLGFSATTLHNIIQSGDNAQLLKKIRPGQTLRFAKDQDNICIAVDYDIDRIKTLKVYAVADGFKSLIEEKPVEISHSTASAKINNSLFYDGKQAGLSDKTIMELANIFGWDIDFSQGLRQGDSFALVYETKNIDGKPIENGNILAAEFINRGDKYQAVRFVSNDGHAEYFSPEGKSMRKAFLRNPIDFARVSSRFNLRRKHPVLNRIRAHKGVDYAASTGTSIKSTGDGKVIFRGVKGGYGRVVIVQHGQKYSTLYAHMSKYGRYKKGSRIKQGQIVGYVGKSGLATGPHLHYELRINGVHRNPLTAKFPSAKPINKSLLAKFKQQTTPLLAQLEHTNSPTQLALNR